VFRLADGNLLRFGHPSAAPNHPSTILVGRRGYRVRINLVRKTMCACDFAFT